MYDYLILTEKTSEFDQFVQALGGETGFFNNHSYKLVHARGHLLELDDPENQVMPSLAAKFKKWNLENIPWNLHDFSWKKVPKRNKKTKKPDRQVLSLLKEIKAASNNAEAIVIATDTDATTGEGELLAWEIINYIGWHGPVYREYHADESPAAIQEAMKNLHDVSNQDQDGWFVKGNTRNRWDYGSMQLTEAATLLVQNAGYYVKVINEGRLKSVAISLIYQRLLAIKNYVKRPFYEIKFKDNQGFIYARKVDKNDEETIKQIRHLDKEGAIEESKNYQSPTPVTVDSKQLKSQIPHTFTDLTKLDGTLSHKGYSSSMIQNVYQVMYQKYKFLSYPRSDDKTVTPAQFDELVKNRNQIANLVGVDPNLLTHLTPRKELVKKSATHGANRPGSKVPRSLDEIREIFKTKKEQDCAVDIYTQVAVCALAILGENYEYYQVKAHLTKYPDFVCSYTQPANYNYRIILQGQTSLPAKKPDPGTMARGFIYCGANPKPAWPTKKWLYGRLNSYKYSIGTPATQQSTISSISDPNENSYLLTANKEKLNLTQQGLMAALIAQDTYIASPQVTVQLFQLMQAVGEFKVKPEAVLATLDQVISHDLPVMVKNVDLIKQTIPLPKKKDPKDYVDFEYQGKTIHFKKIWGKHTFTNAELQALSQGESITFKYGRKSITGSLGPKKFRGKTYINFIPDFDKSNKKK